eukprot:gi/632982966/ref/XP_007908415.1/ PREDICTED: lymphoid-restricted membrane protein-like [Callorhinchus milii]
MSSAKKLPLTLQRSLSASSLFPVPTFHTDELLGYWRDQEIPGSPEVSGEQKLEAGWTEGSMSPGSEQWPERERQVSTMDTPHSGHGSLKMKNVSHHKTTQEKSGETGDNADIPCDPKTVADVRVADSEESEEDSTSDDSLSDAQKDISILKRLGLHREFLTDKEVESAFIHLSLAFKSDTFTLKKRLQVEERARDVAEENIQMELQGCKTILQRLMSVCVDGRRQEILAQLEKSLQILDTSITRVSGRSEVLGAVHQEARVSRGVEVMIQHVENLKRLHVREHTELQEMRRIILQNSRSRPFPDTPADEELRNKHQIMRAIQQSTARRRVSIAVIPKQLTTFHNSDSKVGESEVGRTEAGVTKSSGDRRRLFNRKMGFPCEEPSEDSTAQTPQTGSGMSGPAVPSESSQHKHEGTFVRRPRSSLST